MSARLCARAQRAVRSTAKMNLSSGSGAGFGTLGDVGCFGIFGG
jgi:hypothetical protein